MAIKFNRITASAYLRRIVSDTENQDVSQEWVSYIQELSRLCDAGIASTHIAFLGAELLAKSLDETVDLYYIKPTKAPENKKAKSYSARTLCHGVLVPIATEFDIDLGVTGAEPLNNQPYFRMNYLGDETAVHTSSKAAWDYMVELVGKLARMNQTESEAALRAFAQVRKNAGTVYGEIKVAESLEPMALANALETLVSQGSENGRRAQAAAAGLLDAVYGVDRVDTGSGRVNDPSRKRPGDVCIRSANTPAYDKSFEVKDKPVNSSDILRFIRNGAKDYQCRDFGYLALAASQAVLDEDSITAWAEKRGASIAIYYNWREFVQQSLFWAPPPTQALAGEAAMRIAARLREIEASAEAFQLWSSLVGR